MERLERRTPLLVSYWIEFAPRDWFEIDDDETATPPRMFGVTAASLDAALTFVRETAFGGGALPTIRSVVEDVDLGMLAMCNMAPGALPPDRAGIWYPSVTHPR